MASNDIAFEGVTPILPVANLEASLDYYVRVLGFEKKWQERWFACVQRGRCGLFLSEGGDQITDAQGAARQAAKEIGLALAKTGQILQALFGRGRGGEQQIDAFGERGRKMRGEVGHFAMRARVVLKFESAEAVQAAASTS